MKRLLGETARYLVLMDLLNIDLHFLSPFKLADDFVVHLITVFIEIPGG